MAIDGAVQQAHSGGHFPLPTDQSRLSPHDSAVLVSHAQQPLGDDGFIRTLNADHLRFT